MFEPTDPTEDVLGEIYAERERQDARWGEQNHPNGTGGHSFRDAADSWRRINDDNATKGTPNHAAILLEEVFEAVAEDDVARLREELIQVAAVACCWIEKLDREAKK